MTTTTMTKNLQERLARLYEEGRYRETLREAAALEVSSEPGAAGSVELARALQMAGCAHRELNELSEAEDRLLLALRLLATPEGRAHPAYARGLEELGYLYELMGRHDQAEGLYRQALECHARNPAADREGHARCLQCLSELCGLLCRRREAVEALRRAQEIRAEAFGKDHPEFARGLLAEAWIGFRIGKSLATEGQARKGLQILRAARGEQHPALAAILQGAGRVVLAFGHYDEAERMLEQARDIRRASVGETHPGFASVLESLAVAKLARCRPGEAETLARRALEIERTAAGGACFRGESMAPARLEVAWYLGTLGNALQAGGKLTEAEECHRQALDVARSLLGERSPAVAEMLGELADTLTLAGRTREAEEVLREAVALLESAGPDTAFERVQMRQELGRFLLTQGQNEEAARLAEEARKEADSFAAEDPFVMAPACLLLARALHPTGQLAPAAQEIRRAEALVKPLPPHHSLIIDATYARMEHLLYGNELRSAVLLGQECARQVSRALGETHPSHPQILRYLAELRHREGDFEESERLFEQALSLFRRHWGAEHPEVADTLRGLARLHLSRNNPAAAETRFGQARDIRRAVLGEQHPDYAECLIDLARLNQQTGNFLGADLFYRQALDVLRVDPGEDHPDYASALHGRASVLMAVNEPAEAEKLLGQALGILRAETDNPHPRALEVRHTLALLHASRSEFLRAEEILKQVLADYERILGPDHEALVPVLSDLGRLYEAMGDLVASGPVVHRILALNVRAHGEGSVPYAFDLVTASNLARLKGDHAQAESQARRALSIVRAAVPDGHPALVDFLRPLALACQAGKNYREAEQLLNQALALTVAAFGPRNPAVAWRQGDLGNLFAQARRGTRASGSSNEAGRRYETAADLIRDTMGEDHPDHAGARRVLGLHYQSRGDHARAEKALRKAMEVTRRTAGENHPAVAGALQALAELCRARGDLPGAEGHYREALDVLRRSEVPADALQAALLHGQALVLLQQRRPQEAEPLLRAALDIDQTAGGSDTLGHLESVGALAHLCAASGRDGEAATLLRKVLESAYRLAPSFCCLRHDGTPSPFWAHLWDLCEMLLTLAVRNPNESSACAPRELFDAVLRCKGLGPKGMVLAEREELLREHPGRRTQLETRFALGRQAACRSAGGAGAEGLETHHRLLARWQEEREALEQGLEREVPALARQRRWLTADAKGVADALPPGSVLVEYVRYRPRDFAGLCTGKEEAGPARYVAFVIHAGRSDDVRLVDLGEAEPVDRLAGAACGLLGRRRARASLAERILAPLASHCEGCRSVVLVASGRLGQVRFAEGPGGIAVQRQVTSARELLDLPAAVSPEAAGWLARLWRSLRGRA